MALLRPSEAVDSVDCAILGIFGLLFITRVVVAERATVLNQTRLYRSYRSRILRLTANHPAESDLSSPRGFGGFSFPVILL